MSSKNKGFSLLEIIIVVTIIAVLLGVLTPSFIKYVEKSKHAKRLASADAFRRCFDAATVDVLALQHFSLPSNGTFTVRNGILYVSDTASPDSVRYNHELKKVLDTIYTADYPNILSVSVHYNSNGTPKGLYVVFTEGRRKYEYAYDPPLSPALLALYEPIKGSNWYFRKI